MPIYKQKEKNKEGLSKYRIKVNYTDDFGNHKQLTRIAWGLQGAKELERRLQHQINNKEFSVNISLDSLFSEYTDTIKHDVRATTLIKKIELYTNHIQPLLGNVPLSKLDTRILNKWKNATNEKELRLISKKNIYTVLNSILNYAVKMDYLASNPLKKIGNFKDAYRQEKDIVFYTPDEFMKYKATALEFARNSGYYDYYIFFCIAYYTGARKGEIHALRWDCLQDNKLSIKRSITQKLKGGDVETPPKNKSSIRTVQIPQVLIDILEEHKRRQQKQVPNWKNNGYICGYYQPLRDTAIDNENRKYAAAAGLKHIRIHDFRHSHASLLINQNISALEVAHRLGHSTVEQTLKTYSHLFPDEEEKAVAILENIK